MPAGEIAPVPEQAAVAAPAPTVEKTAGEVTVETVEPLPPQPEAKTPTTETAQAKNTHDTQVVIFTLSSESYAVDIIRVESIIKMQPITVVPHAPPFIEGVTNLRGQILSVVDLRTRFGLSRTEATKDTRIMVVKSDDLTVGMVVDAVTEVLRIPVEAIEPPSPLVTTVDSAFITGIAKVDERLVILLDLSKVLVMQEDTPLEALSSVA